MPRHIPEHPQKGSVEAYEWAERMRQARQKKARTKAAVREAGQLTEMQFFGPGGSLEVKPRSTRNPGKRYHDAAAAVAGRYRKGAANNQERALYAGMEIAHKDSAKAAKNLGMNPKKKAYTRNLVRQCAWCKKVLGEVAPYNDTRTTHGICEACLKKEMQEARKLKKNPIAVYNPPAQVAGTIYKSAIEIRAKKSGSDLAGKYKHIFGKGVRILGLTDGTVLLQHKDGKPLWISRKDYERSGGEHE